MGLAALALAIALPAHANVVPLKGAQLIFADWADSADIGPERPTMEAFHDGIEACRAQGCAAAGDIDRLAWWVARGNRLAIRLSFDASRTLDAASDGARTLAQSYGGIIKRDPTTFLAVARDEGASWPMVATDATTTSDLIAGNADAQVRELGARRDALLRVTDPSLAALRDQCVSGIEARIAALRPNGNDA
jgi:hypothetical protein